MLKDFSIFTFFGGTSLWLALIAQDHIATDLIGSGYLFAIAAVAFSVPAITLLKGE